MQKNSHPPKPLVIFGIGKTAHVLVRYLEKSGIVVTAFSVEAEFTDIHRFADKPVVNFSQVSTIYPPADFDIMIAVGYQQMNTQRERIYNECKALGYKLATYVHSTVTRFDEGDIGDGCVLLDHVTIQPGASVADNTFIWSNSVIAHDSVVGAHCWIAAGTTVAGNATIKKNCFLGVNCTIGHNVTLGKSTFVGANTLVSKDTDDGTTIISAEGQRLRLNSQQFCDFAKL